MKVLIVDDNTVITENISLYLEQKWYRTVEVHNGEEAFDCIKRESFDFLIVDRMIPKIDGISLIRLMKSRNIKIPFIFLTALGKTIDRIEGLSMGADDYLVKPFDLEELFLRIENIMHRSSGGSHVSNHRAYYFGSIFIDTDAKLVLRDGRPIELSPKEYALLVFLAENQGMVMSRESIYDNIWGGSKDPFEDLGTVNVHISRIRRKLSADIIRTVKLEWFVIDRIT